jgi:O-antigen/teichoic acid export membrane protein
MRKLAATAGANLVVPLTALLVTPLLARELGPEGRGEFAALTVTIIVLGIIGTGGMQDAFTYFVAKGRLGARRALRLTWLLTAPLSLLMVVLVVVASQTLFSGNDVVRTGILWLAVLVPVHIQFNLLQGITMGRGDLKLVNILNASQAVIRMAVTVAACLLLDLSALWAAAILLSSYLIGQVVMHWRLASAATPSGADEPPVKEVAVFGASSIVAVIASMSSMRLNQILGLALIGPAELGFYAAAAGIAELPLIVAQAGRMVLMSNPKTAEDPAQGLPVLRWCAGLSLLGCTGVALIAPWAVPLYLGGEFAGSVRPVMILSLAAMLSTVATLLSALLLMSGRPGLQSRAIIAGAVTGVAALIPFASLGAAGAAWAAVTGAAVTTIVALWDVRKALGLGPTHLLGLTKPPSTGTPASPSPSPDADAQLHVLPSQANPATRPGTSSGERPGADGAGDTFGARLAGVTEAGQPDGRQPERKGGPV